MHPAARRVSEIMRANFATLDADDRLDYADRVMRFGHVRHMPVLEKERVIGVVSHRDVLAASLSEALAFARKQRDAFLHSVAVREVMTREVVTVGPDDTLEEAARRMLHHKIGCVPVVSPEGAAVGLVTETDLLRAAFLGDADTGDAEDAPAPEA